MGWAWEAIERPPAGSQGGRSAGVQVLSVSGKVSKENRLGFSQDVFLLGLYTLDLAPHDPRLFTSLFFLEKSPKSSKTQTLTFLVISYKKLGKSKPQMLERGFLTFLSLLLAWTLSSL